jgi:hypothetical protein
MAKNVAEKVKLDRAIFLPVRPKARKVAINPLVLLEHR